MDTKSTGTLFIVATPIGNMQDITLRALETLKTVDLILAEDTRRTGQLLNQFTINKPMKRFDDFVKNKGLADIISLLKSGQNLALVSDAGTPLISDPGFKLVREAAAQGITVNSIPGASAALTALTTAGLPSDKFLFIGFLPEKPGKRRKLLVSLLPFCHSGVATTTIESSPSPNTKDPITSFQDDSPIKATIIIYESPYRLQKTLTELLEIYGDIPIVICRELTKLHEETFRGPISKAQTHFKQPKGEIVILI